MHVSSFVVCVLAFASTVIASHTTRVQQHGVHVGLGSPCAVDSDCALANAVCWPIWGNALEGGHCACDYGNTWNAAAASCATPESLGREIAAIDRRVRLSTQANATVPPRLWWSENYHKPFLVRPAQPAPPVWHCDAIARICWAAWNGVQYVSVLPGNFWLIRYRSLGETHIPIADVYWRCATATTGLRFRRVLDSGALNVAKESAMRAPDEHCGACDSTWCSGHGSCSDEDAFECTCDSGWSGSRCETPDEDLYPVPPIQTCTFDDDCNMEEVGRECWRVTEGARLLPTRRCVCAPGYAARTREEVAAGASACVRVENVQSLVGATITPGEVAVVNFGASAPTSVWWQNEHSKHVALVADAADTTAAVWKLHTSVRAWQCVNGNADFFVDRTKLEDPNAHCLGALAVCGQGVDVTASVAATGMCACAYPFARVNNRCTTCVEGRAGPQCTEIESACGTTHCNGRGVCADGAVQTLAALPLPEAVNGELPGDALLPEYCVCDDLGFGDDGDAAVECRNTTACVALELSSDSAVIGRIAGSTAEPITMHHGTRRPARADTLPACLCTGGAGGESCEERASECTARVCSAEGRGTCVGTNKGDECACTRVDGELQWFGATCNLTRAACAASRCNSGGVCLHQQQGCVCDAFHTGAACETIVCANGQSIGDGGVCACSADFSGTYCETWVCGQDSHLVNGVCECAGLWTADADGRCTKHPCGVGAPQLGLPTMCRCEGRATTHVDAPHCRRACRTANQTHHAQDGTCVCPAGFGGPMCADAYGSVPPVTPIATTTTAIARTKLTGVPGVTVAVVPTIQLISQFVHVLKMGLKAGFMRLG